MSKALKKFEDYPPEEQEFMRELIVRQSLGRRAPAHHDPLGPLARLLASDEFLPLGGPTLIPQRGLHLRLALG